MKHTPTAPTARIPRPLRPSTVTAPRRALLAAGLVLAVLPGASLRAQPRPGVPQPGPALPATPGRPGTAAAGAARTIDWDALIPPGWDPMKDLKGLDFSTLSDADPRAAAALSKLREVWDQAPANPALAGQRVRLPGYIVPLEETRAGLKEFLLVPYFGACIHTPPPPANQIVHVLPRVAAPGFRSMDTVWVTGVMTVVRTDSYMGVAGYRLEAEQVTAYTQRPPASR
jgi:hypothetical protein